MLVLIAFFVTIASAQQVATQFSSNLTITYPGTSTKGQLWFDYRVKGAAVDVPNLQFKGVATPVITSQASVYYAILSGSCQQVGATQWVDFPPLTLPPICSLTSTTSINGVPSKGYTCPLPDNLAVTIFLSVADNTPTRVNGTTTLPGFPLPFVVDFTGTTVGNVPPSVYAKPAGCP